MSYDNRRGAPRKKSNTTLIIVIVAVCVSVPVMLCGGVALLLPAVQQAREAARRSSCKNNLKQIGVALHSYHEVYGCFPPAFVADKDGQPMHKWRVLILPFLEAGPLYDRYRFDEPWNGPNNRLLVNSMPAVYGCPSSPASNGQTHYVTLRGPQTLFPGADVKSFRDVKDGTSTTFAAVEAPGLTVNWMAPDDVSPEDFLRSLSGETHHAGGTHVLLVNGDARFISSNAAESIVKNWMSIAGGEQPGDL